jgi:hypothetical protein
MHGLPRTFDSSFLKGRAFESVSFLPYQVNLYLTDGVWLQIEGRYKLLQDNIKVEAVSGFPVSQSALPQVIGKKVVSVDFNAPSGDLNIALEGGLSLFVEGDTGPYESYRLFDGSKEVVV